ncbi:MAG: ATP-binding protein [Methanolobus sp.]|nr:ATP-binding protein [Methanolobus sp.]
MLKKPNELDFKDKKFAMIIAGFPGIGKTTLALSAPKPLLIDADQGIDRVEPKYRKDSLQIETYEELLNDLESAEIKNYETLIIDTGAELLELMKPYVIKKNTQNGQRDGSLTLKGYGAVGLEFTRLIKNVKRMGKNIIVVFHTKEDKDGDFTKLRIAIEGQSKDNIWKYIDIGGFMEMIGKKRTIGFSNCERYFAKGVHGVTGLYEIDELKNDMENTFVADLFNFMKEKIMSESESFNQEEKDYNEAMKVKLQIDKVTTVEQANRGVEYIKTRVKHALTSEKELKHYLHNKAISLGFVFSKKDGLYVLDNSKPIE